MYDQIFVAFARIVSENRAKRESLTKISKVSEPTNEDQDTILMSGLTFTTRDICIIQVPSLKPLQFLRKVKTFTLICKVSEWSKVGQVLT